MTQISDIENVVRIIFPSTMMRDGELLPSAFNLRELKDGSEKCISVFRRFHVSFESDIKKFDRNRNLPCCVLNVGDINTINLKINNIVVKYMVDEANSDIYPSHCGIFITLNNIPLEGSGKKVFELLKVGESASFISMAIRRRLVDIAKRKITSVMYLF
ncbi:MAG: hypothetical protein IKO99_11630 [Bacteroidales bacterium]|nr:hypothetical protein [Bacteroidales bacterium]